MTTAQNDERVFTDKDRAIEVAHLRASMVERAVERQINHRDGNVTSTEIDRWQNEEYRKWRERWPALNSLLIPHGPVGGQADG